MFGSSIIHITWINIVIYFVAAWNISSIIFLSLAACFHTCPAQQPNWLCVLPPALHHRDKPIAYQAARLHGDGGSFSDWPGEKEVCYESKFMNRCVLRLIIVAFFHVWSMCVCIHVCIYLCAIFKAINSNPLSLCMQFKHTHTHTHTPHAHTGWRWGVHSPHQVIPIFGALSQLISGHDRVPKERSHFYQQSRRHRC